MIRILLYISIITILISCSEKKPLVFDTFCQKVRFPKIENNLNSFPNTSKKIELTEDSTFIGMWADIGSTSIIRYYFTQDNKLFKRSYRLYYFEENKDIEIRKVWEKKVFRETNIDYIAIPNTDNPNEKLKNQTRDLISEDGQHIYSIDPPSSSFEGSVWKFSKIDSITQPFAERDAYLDFIEVADSNTIAWYPSGSILMRWYKKDNIDYMMWISEGGYECVPIELKKTRKGYKLIALEGTIYGDYISLDSSMVFTPSNSFKDTLSTTSRLRPENYERLIDNRFMYHLMEYDGAYLPD